MNSALDTLKREPLMEVMETILNELRICRVLLSNTSFCIKLGKHERENVKTSIGSQQGDGISGIFFNIALENALRTLQAVWNEGSDAEISC